MKKLDPFKAKARALARSGHFYGLPPSEFELSLEEGFHEAGEWLEPASTKEELKRICQESRDVKPPNLLISVTDKDEEQAALWVPYSTPAGETKLHGLRLADRARQPLRAAGSGTQASTTSTEAAGVIGNWAWISF